MIPTVGNILQWLDRHGAGSGPVLERPGVVPERPEAGSCRARSLLGEGGGRHGNRSGETRSEATAASPTHAVYMSTICVWMVCASRRPAPRGAWRDIRDRSG